MSVLSERLEKGASWAVARPAALVEPLLVAAISVGLLALIHHFSTDIAGGSDAYGYVSEAVRLAHGHFYEAEHVFAPFGMPENSNLTFTLGYRPLGSAGLVPTYPFGYPLLMAVAIRLAGLLGAFWVSPILGTGAVLLTYLTGRQLLGRIGGLIAAAIVAVLPNFLWSAFQPMSDVPATFLAALALYALLGRDRSLRSTLLLALAEGLAIWVRPNLALLVLPTGLWFLVKRDWKRLLAFGLLLVPFVAVEGAVNNYLYGAPWATGYGDPPFSHSLADAVQRAERYLVRLQDQQAGIGLILLVVGIAFGKLSWRLRLFLVGVAAPLFLFFSFYTIDDAWWYGRFLLPILPTVALLEASVLVRLAEAGRYREARMGALAIGAVAFGYASIGYASSHDVFRQADGDQRYRVAAEYARAHVRQPALVLTMQHSGTLRFYGDMPSARYDLGSLPELLGTIDRVRQAGGQVYLLADQWEFDSIQKGNRAVLLAGAEKIGQVEPGPVLLYQLDPPLLAGDQRPGQPTQITFANPTGAPIRLDGYTVSASAAHPGSPLAVTLYWQATGNTGADYSVFIHVADPSGQIIAQSDSYPENNRYPTSHWTAGYVIADRHDLALPKSAPPGNYKITVGLYQYQTLRRLQPRDQVGPLKTDEVSLGQIQVIPEN